MCVLIYAQYSFTSILINSLLLMGIIGGNPIVYIGAEKRFKTRLVVEKVPENVSKQRREHYRKVSV